MQWLSIVWLHVPESQFSYQQSRRLSLQICLNWLYQLQLSTFWCIISRPLQSLIPCVPGSLELFPIWPKQHSEAWAFLTNPKYLNSALAGACKSDYKSLNWSPNRCLNHGALHTLVSPHPDCPPSRTEYHSMLCLSPWSHTWACVLFCPEETTALGADARTESHPSP